MLIKKILEKKIFKKVKPKSTEKKDKIRQISSDRILIENLNNMYKYISTKELNELLRYINFKKKIYKIDERATTNTLSYLITNINDTFILNDIVQNMIEYRKNKDKFLSKKSKGNLFGYDNETKVQKLLNQMRANTKAENDKLLVKEIKRE